MKKSLAIATSMAVAVSAQNGVTYSPAYEDCDEFSLRCYTGFCCAMNMMLTATTQGATATSWIYERKCLPQHKGTTATTW